MEELASGSKMAYGDNIGLLNFSENLNAATRILKEDVERVASVATNLRRIVNRLPNDLRANPCKNRPKSPIRGKAQKSKSLFFCRLVHFSKSTNAM